MGKLADTKSAQLRMDPTGRPLTYRSQRHMTWDDAMESLRLTLIAPAVWLSGRLNFALKYWTLGLGVALVGSYLSMPLYDQVNTDIHTTKTQLDGVRLLAHQNQIFLQMVRLRTELGPRPKDGIPTSALSEITTKIDDMLRNAKSSEEAKLAIVLGREWTRVSTESPEDSSTDRFASFNAAIYSLLVLSRESARSYRLNLDPELDAAFDMMANRLPATIDTITRQNQVIQRNVANLSAAEHSARISLNDAIPTLRAGVTQLSEQTGDTFASTSKPSKAANPNVQRDMPANLSLMSRLQDFLSGMMLQQDAVDQVSQANASTGKSARSSLDAVSQTNLENGQTLLTESASIAQTILKARIERLYKARLNLSWALVASGALIGYLLYAFYISLLRSINALSRGTNAFCDGRRDVRIKLKSRDELSLIATNFNTMAHEVERLVQTIEEQNETRERDLKVLVDALGQKNEELYAVNQRVHEELNLARSVQLAILPQHFPDEPTWAAHACMHPARELGGDFYDCFALPDGRHGVLVADVSGKGVGAAFFMAVSRTVLLDSAMSVRTPAQVLAMANELLCARNPMDLFVTACYGLFNPKDGSFEYASAGHHPPLVRRANGTVEILPTTKDIALGVLSDMQYVEHRTSLQPGDTLLMYTDGVTEAFSSQEIAYGDERLITWLTKSEANSTAAQLVDSLVTDVAHFVDGAEASDDLTCLILCNKRTVRQDTAHTD